MNSQIQQTREMFLFCLEGHDIDGTWPCPFLLRSFATGGDKMEEHRLRIIYYHTKLQQLLNEQRVPEQRVPEQRVPEQHIKRQKF